MRQKSVPAKRRRSRHGCLWWVLSVSLRLFLPGLRLCSLPGVPDRAVLRAAGLGRLLRPALLASPICEAVLGISPLCLAPVVA
jgi:hypothetical protein